LQLLPPFHRQPYLDPIMLQNLVYTSQNGKGVARLVASGKWLYDGVALKPVQIFAVNYDESYEIAKEDGQLEEGETADLNSVGEQYVITWYDGDFFGFGTRDYGGLSLREAIEYAEQQVGQKISWTD
jgi:hypothetical protein